MVSVMTPTPARGIQRLIKGSVDRKTRLHTCRGTLLPINRWKDLPAALSYRVTGRELQVPWMSPGSIDALSELLLPSMQLLELGGGASTSWYAARVGHVTCIEPSASWADEIMSRAREAGVQHKVTIVNDTVQSGLSALQGRRFDIAVDDFDPSSGFSRLDALPMLQALGCTTIVLDDSDLPHHQAADAVLSSWTVQRFPGFRSRPLQATETSIFTKPHDEPLD